MVVHWEKKMITLTAMQLYCLAQQEICSCCVFWQQIFYGMFSNGFVPFIIELAFCCKTTLWWYEVSWLQGDGSSVVVTVIWWLLTVTCSCHAAAVCSSVHRSLPGYHWRWLWTLNVKPGHSETPSHWKRFSARMTVIVWSNGIRLVTIRTGFVFYRVNFHELNLIGGGAAEGHAMQNFDNK